MTITQPHILDYLKSLTHEQRLSAQTLVDMMEETSHCKPKLWRTIVGFGKLYYRYPTGHDGYMPILAFAMRAKQITLYLSLDVAQLPGLKKLGMFKIGKSCLYIKKLSDVNIFQLKKLIQSAYEVTLNYDFVQLIEEN
jgi:hypothetical protein